MYNWAPISGPISLSFHLTRLSWALFYCLFFYTHRIVLGAVLLSVFFILTGLCWRCFTVFILTGLSWRCFTGLLYTHRIVLGAVKLSCNDASDEADRVIDDAMYLWYAPQGIGVLNTVTEPVAL